MKKYTIELSEELSTTYEGLAKMDKKSTEEVLQNMLKQVVETFLNRNVHYNYDEDVNNCGVRIAP